MCRHILTFFDKLEDEIRGALSHYPIVYSIIGSIGIILLWRGIWVIADEIGMSGVTSLVISIPLLLATGLFVSFFIGDQIIISGLRGEKKITDMEERELEEEIEISKQIKKKLDRIEERMKEIETAVK